MTVWRVLRSARLETTQPIREVGLTAASCNRDLRTEALSQGMERRYEGRMKCYACRALFSDSRSLQLHKPRCLGVWVCAPEDPERQAEFSTNGACGALRT